MAYERRGTYVINRYVQPPSVSAPVSGIQQQNKMRLKVNRIALIQEIKVEHILPTLLAAGVVNKEDEEKIQTGASPGDRARILIDILPTKPASTDWFRYFQASLKNPDAEVEVKQRYRMLLDFLDNTVIHRPSSQNTHFRSPSQSEDIKYPKYEPLPAITEKNQAATVPENTGSDKDTNNDSDPERESSDDQPELDLESSGTSSNSQTSMNMTLIKGFIHQWVPTPDNFKSLIVLPESHRELLKQSKYPEDDEQLQDEKRVLQKMKKLEFVAALVRQKQLPNGFELCMCEMLHDILSKPNTYHLYFKYFTILRKAEVDLVKEITDSFQSLVDTVKIAKNLDMLDQIVNTGFQLIDFLTEYEHFSEAEYIAHILLDFLNSNPNIETWVAKYRCCVKLMHLRNRNYNLTGAADAYFCAIQMTWTISQMSFGQNIVKESELYGELSHMLLEQGAITSAFGWANRALLEVQDTNWVQIIHTLCTATMAYTSRWQVKRAEMLAVHCVQLARLHFGKHHPLYLKALIHFCHFSNEFLQDQAGVKIAFKALELSQKIYGHETLQQALAHRAVSKALMVVQQFDSSEHYQHAMEAIRIARSLLPQSHPMLGIFLHTFSLSLQWKAVHDLTEVQDTTLSWSEAEAKLALSIVTEHYGPVSLRAAQLYALLGQIYAKMEKLGAAEENMLKSIEYMKLCQPANSNYVLLSMATLGTFYTSQKKPKQAISLLTHVVNTVESTGFYLKWVHICYDNLISLLQTVNDNDEMDKISVQLSKWLSENPKHDTEVTLDTLDDQPINYNKFISILDRWVTGVRKALQHADEQKEDQ
ncbi:amyloid protein-binding protein 2-like [Gigantopelta aegis]|uniref:amyloid protein-binding protein 2-like n=1 Tax=Gigantopelta aegis TaxID=1735272 RepID=UPI001B887DB7|nr:amyloid protein-binding protein 2-like [Gigantopelta aegis]